MPPPGAFLLVVVLVWPGAVARGAFSSGVASGDVTDTAAILWTRADQAGTVRVQVAADQDFSQIVQEAQADATAATDYTVQFDVQGLAPRTLYYYRFLLLQDPAATSIAGTFRTSPAPDQAVGFRFILSGDSDYSRGPFHVLADATEQEPDLFIYFGDTIYGDIPAGELGIARTLDEYRAKYVQNRYDQPLRDLLARTPVMVGWDDHEVVNDYWGAEPGAEAGPDLTPERVAAGYQAFFEYMPIRDAGDPQDPFRTYRAIRYGSLAEFFLLDGRQYREPPAKRACGGDPDPFDLFFGGQHPSEECLAILREPRAYLGAAQMEWLKATLLNSTARYKFVVTDQPMSFLGLLPYDRWDGYDAERKELLEFIDANLVESVWLLSTDVHMSAFTPDVTTYFREQRPDYRLDNGVVVAEIVACPIAAETLRQAALKTALEALGSLGELPVTQNFLNLTLNSMMLGIARANAWAFWQADRYAYVLVDVSPENGVTVSFRGYDPAAHGEQRPLIHTLYDSAAPISLPCWVVPGTVFALIVPIAAYGLRGRWASQARTE
ncbi:MAG: alkaline phosphatase D family protein [Phycisphaerales bacterium]|nr:MAG: alkaline phosphatase D family protein [Phycisphaerales bacterium]